MDPRTVVAFVGEDASAGERVSRAVDAIWDGPNGPELRTFAATNLDADRDSEDPLSVACGVLVTAAATGNDSVTERLAALPSNVPVIALVEDDDGDDPIPAGGGRGRRGHRRRLEIEHSRDRHVQPARRAPRKSAGS